MYAHLIRGIRKRRRGPNIIIKNVATPSSLSENDITFLTEAKSSTPSNVLRTTTINNTPGTTNEISKSSSVSDNTDEPYHLLLLDFVIKGTYPDCFTVNQSYSFYQTKIAVHCDILTYIYPKLLYLMHNNSINQKLTFLQKGCCYPTNFDYTYYSLHLFQSGISL